jgi:hypothetical protein
MNDRIRYDLVYQCGIANVFRVNVPFPGQAQTPTYTRIMQHAYEPCERFCAGLIEAGAEVAVWHSDSAGDVLLCPYGPWQMGKGGLWADKKNPPIKAAYAND